MLTTKKGMVIKIQAEEIPEYGRNSRGVKLMKVEDDELSSVAVIA
jgi:DNA gyrase/topoisomerase IV subunit A